MSFSFVAELWHSPVVQKRDLKRRTTKSETLPNKVVKVMKSLYSANIGGNDALAVTVWDYILEKQKKPISRGIGL